MMRFYKANPWRNDIESIEVIRETADFLIVPYFGKERRVKKESNCEKYFQTFQEAKNYALQRLRKKLEQYINQAETTKKEIEEMEETEEVYEKPEE